MYEECLKFSHFKQNIVQEQTNAIGNVSQKEKKTTKLRQTNKNPKSTIVQKMPMAGVQSSTRRHLYSGVRKAEIKGQQCQKLRSSEERFLRHQQNVTDDSVKEMYL